MVKLNNVTPELITGVKKIITRIEKVAAENVAPSREMQMVPKYLELASLKGKDRFNPSEVEELTELVKAYVSEIPPTDLIKELLAIGSQKGEVLSFKELKDFLISTDMLDKKGQTRVIEFMRALKEKDTFKYDSKYVKENMTFENFKKEIANDPYRRHMLNWGEEKLRQHHRELLKKELDMIQYKPYTSQFEVSPLNTSKFINNMNPKFVACVASCEKPEILAEIAQKFGTSVQVAMSANYLVKAFELSKGNMNLVEDLLRGFYPVEIKQIVTKLASTNVDLSKYTPHTVDPNDMYTIRKPMLSTQRNRVLKALDLTGQIELYPLQTYEVGSPIKIVSGSFEQGKRR